MGMDVYIDGELTVPAAKLPEAKKLLLAAIVTEKGGEIVEDPDGIDFLTLAEQMLESFGVQKEDNGDITFGVEYSIRREEYDQWIFEALAPVIDDGEFYMSGDDYKWKWMVKDGEFGQADGEIVYDRNTRLEPTIEKIIELMYPGGKPLQAEGSDAISTLNEIENLLRENGFGPQAGMTELDRMAEVGG
jgi:hypothetical protein